MAGDVTLMDETRAEGLEPARVRNLPWVPIVLVGVIGFGSGVSPLFYGFYSFSTWGVIALVVLALLCGLVLGGQTALARLPALLRRALHRHLSRLLPADGRDADPVAAHRADP